jgi:hypothetical protein
MKEDLDDLLRSWSPDAIEASTFKHDVWRRIEQSRSAAERVQGFFEMCASSSAKRRSGKSWE